MEDLGGSERPHRLWQERVSLTGQQWGDPDRTFWERQVFMADLGGEVGVSPSRPGGLNCTGVPPPQTDFCFSRSGEGHRVPGAAQTHLWRIQVHAAVVNAVGGKCSGDEPSGTGPHPACTPAWLRWCPRCQKQGGLTYPAGADRARRDTARTPHQAPELTCHWPPPAPRPQGPISGIRVTDQTLAVSRPSVPSLSPVSRVQMVCQRLTRDHAFLLMCRSPERTGAWSGSAH